LAITLSPNKVTVTGTRDWSYAGKSWKTYRAIIWG